MDLRLSRFSFKKPPKGGFLVLVFKMITVEESRRRYFSKKTALQIVV